MAPLPGSLSTAIVPPCSLLAGLSPIARNTDPSRLRELFAAMLIAPPLRKFVPLTVSVTDVSPCGSPRPTSSGR